MTAIALICGGWFFIGTASFLGGEPARATLEAELTAREHTLDESALAFSRASDALSRMLQLVRDDDR